MYAAIAAYNASLASHNFGDNTIAGILIAILSLVQLGFCIWAVIFM